MDRLHAKTLPKSERLCSQKALDELFGSGNKSVSAYPIRAVFVTTEESGTRILVSVSKRFFKRAVKRNRIKRQLREAYRLNKYLLDTSEGKGLNIAFLWSNAGLLPTKVVMGKMKNILSRVNEYISSRKEE